MTMSLVRALGPNTLATLLLLAVIAAAFAPSVRSASAQEHHVQPGETLSQIAARYGTSMANLVEINGLSNANVIFAGATLRTSTTQSPVTGSGGQTHLVRSGETLSGIAQQYGTTVAALLGLNNLSSANLIFAGTTLRVEGGTGGATPPVGGTTTYTVAPGDSLSSIAARFQVSLSALADINQIENRNYIWAGQVLALPDGATSAPATVSRDAAETAIRAAAAEFGLSPSLLLALAWQESGWQQHVVSHAGAVGVMQVMPGTAVWVMDYLMGEDLDWRGSVRDNARVGAAVLAHWMNLSGGDTHMALGSYYQGWGAMQAYGPYDETVLYIQNVLSLQNRYR